MRLLSSANPLVIRLLFMTLSSNFARGDHGACAVFERKMSYMCYGSANDSKACASVVDGIISPELCASPSCQLGSILGMLVPAAVVDFLLQIILVIVLVVMYLPQYHPAQRRTLCHTILRCVKLATPFIGMATCILTLLCFLFLSQAAWPLLTMGCVAMSSSSWDSVETLTLWVIVLFLAIFKFIAAAVLGVKDVYERRASALTRELFQDLVETTTATDAQKLGALRAIWSRSWCECVFHEVLRDISARKRYQQLHRTTEANEVDGATVYTDEVNTFNDEMTLATDANEADQNADKTTQTMHTGPSFNFHLIMVHVEALFCFIDRSHS